VAYKELTFQVPKEEFDLFTSELFSLGCLGAQVLKEGELVELKAYFPQDFTLPNSLRPYLRGEGELLERDWNEEWKKHYRPVQVSKRIWVVPSWFKGEFKEPEGSVVIYIHPGRGFGTGTHETTKLSMRLIEEFLREGSSLLDVGTGSGILAILAKKLGAGRVAACDIQRGIGEEVERNASLSGVSQIEFTEGSAGDVEGQFDIVVANIEKHLLEPILPQIAQKSKGLVIISGILKEQREEFLNRCRELGLKPLKEEEEGRWMGFVLKK